GGVAHPVWTDARVSNFPPQGSLREEVYTAAIRYADTGAVAWSEPSSPSLRRGASLVAGSSAEPLRPDPVQPAAEAIAHWASAADPAFTTPDNQGERSRIDLLPVPEHALGHLLGLEHSAGGVLAGTLARWTRHMPTASSTANDPALLDP